VSKINKLRVCIDLAINVDWLQVFVIFTLEVRARSLQAEDLFESLGDF